MPSPTTLLRPDYESALRSLADRAIADRLDCPGEAPDSPVSDRLAAIRARLAETVGDYVVLSPDPPELRLRRPENVQPAVWAGLAADSRRKAVRAAVLRTVQTEEAPTADVLAVLYGKEGITEPQIRALDALWNGSQFNDKRNPTVRQLIAYVMERMREGKPLRLALTQCIDNDPELYRRCLGRWLRENDLGDLPARPAERFVRGRVDKGGDALRSMLAALPRDTEAVLYLGDRDFSTISECDACLSDAELERLEGELAALQATTQREMDEATDGRVEVRRWSQDYDLSAYGAQLARADGDRRWLDDRLRRQSEREFLQCWEFEGLFRELPVSPSRLAPYVESRVVRTAAQYRLEANLVRQAEAVQLWAEKAGDPLWSLRISDYDGSGLPPSLILEY